MVSTRQMATSGSNSAHPPNQNHNQNNNNNNGNNNTAVVAAALESARLSVVTRQTSSNYVLVNCSTIPPTQRSLTQAAGLAGETGATGSPGTSSALTTRQQHNQTTTVQSHTNKVTTLNANADNVVATVPQLLDLPVEVLAKIFEYVGYRKVGHLRLISQKMNTICMDILNSTFSRLITQTLHRFHAIKANMPRRESARRNHPLACECDIIETCYMRLSLLQMTFGKHIERAHCCFFPGAILDEVFNILSYVRNTPRLERPYRVTDELFDLSTMAMEYFKDRIEPTLPDIAYFNKNFFKLPTNTKRPALVTSADHADNSSTIPSPPQSNMVLRKGIRKIKQGMKIYNNQLSVLRSELRTCKRKSAEQGKQIAEQQKLLAEQQKQTLEYANRLDENDKKNEEMSRKFSTLLQELNKCKTELQYWRSKSPAIPTCTTCGQKVVPVLPPEDYQALVNQGVKPEDIILNLNDDTDAESDVSMQEVSAVPEFAFPDQDTTAKLLAVSSATKNQPKRTHTATSSMNTSNQGNSASNICCVAGYCNCSPSSSNSSSISAVNDTIATAADSGCIFAIGGVGSKPSEMTNRLHYVRGSNIIRTTAANAGNSCIGTGVHSQLTQNQSKGHTSATATTTTILNSNTATRCLSPIANAVNNDGEHNNSGSNENVNTAKLYFGSKSHKGVIVSPAMLLANKRQHEQLSADGDMGANETIENVGGDAVVAAVSTRSSVGCNVGSAGNCVTATAANTSVAAVTAAAAAGVEDVVSLQAITSHETKKARRVQKATRCLNGSGKRSK